jgi:hypothetical protein
MITKGPYSLTIGTTLELPDPGATSNNPGTQLQLQNNSPLTINVNSGGTIYTIQSFTAQTVTAAGSQPLSVLPIVSSGASTAANALFVVWLLQGESPPMQDGPLTAAAIASLATIITSQGATDVLQPPTSGVVLNPSVSYTFTALHNYQSLIVFFDSGFVGEVTVEARNNTTDLNTVQTQAVETSQDNTFILSLIANTGDSLTVFITATIGAGPSAVINGVVIDGTADALVTIVQPQAGMPLTITQVGGLTVLRSTATVNETLPLIVAPPNGKAYRLWSFIGAGSMLAQLVGDTSLGTYASVNTTPNQQCVPGQLVTEAMAIIFGGTAGSSATTLTYDVVNIPIFT